MIAIPRFASPVTIGFLLLDVIPVLLIAMPMTLIIITGEIDLSVASIAGLTTAVIGVLWAGGMDIWLVLAISLLAGVVAGVQRVPDRGRRAALAGRDHRHARPVPGPGAGDHRRQRRGQLPAGADHVLHVEDRRHRHPRP